MQKKFNSRMKIRANSIPIFFYTTPFIFMEYYGVAR